MRNSKSIAVSVALALVMTLLTAIGVLGARRKQVPTWYRCPKVRNKKFRASSAFAMAMRSKSVTLLALKLQCS